MDLAQLARDLPGFSGAELANVLNEAALAALRRGGDVVNEVRAYSMLFSAYSVRRAPFMGFWGLVGDLS